MQSVRHSARNEPEDSLISSCPRICRATGSRASTPIRIYSGRPPREAGKRYAVIRRHHRRHILVSRFHSRSPDARDPFGVGAYTSLIPVYGRQHTLSFNTGVASRTSGEYSDRSPTSRSKSRQGRGAAQNGISMTTSLSLRRVGWQAHAFRAGRREDARARRRAALDMYRARPLCRFVVCSNSSAV
jgi:hypothetical protein